MFKRFLESKQQTEWTDQTKHIKSFDATQKPHIQLITKRASTKSCILGQIMFSFFVFRLLIWFVLIVAPYLSKVSLSLFPFSVQFQRIVVTLLCRECKTRFQTSFMSFLVSTWYMAILFNYCFVWFLFPLYSKQISILYFAKTIVVDVLQNVFTTSSKIVLHFCPLNIVNPLRLGWTFEGTLNTKSSCACWIYGLK